ncbi:MAG TPA: kynureninase [Euzebya sp.]|nr:kynureninase [Euzebya sp.]
MHDAALMDAADPLAPIRRRFHIPEGLIYLDGNSLGPLPHGVADRVAEAITAQWGTSLIGGWNDHGWMDLPARVGDRIATLIGAAPGTVVAADSTTVNVAKVISAALRLRPDRRTVLSDSGNFPTDLYVTQGVLDAMGGGHRLQVVAPEEVADVLAGPETTDVAAILLTHVDYRTGRMHDMAALTGAAQDAGALAVWDLAHSAGAVPLSLQADLVDFAVGCSYKYLNGGPGAPAFVYVAPAHANHAQPMLAGWMGHAAPFDFEPTHRPAEGVQRMRVGTPSVLALSALDAALDAWEGVDMTAVRAKSVALTERFIAGVQSRCAAHGLRLVSPRDPDRRGSQVSFAHPDGYAIVQALIADGVVGDFRTPDVLRFGFTPLYTSYSDVDMAVQRLGTVLDERRWDQPTFRQRAAVT